MKQWSGYCCCYCYSYLDSYAVNIRTQRLFMVRFKCIFLQVFVCVCALVWNCVCCKALLILV